jgi:hypothetical protein
MLQQSPKFGGRNSYWIWFQSNGPSFAPSDGTFCRRRPSPRPLIASHSCALGRTAGCRTPPAAAAEPPRAPHTMTAVDLRCPARRLERLRERARRRVALTWARASEPPRRRPTSRQSRPAWRQVPCSTRLARCRSSVPPPLASPVSELWRRTRERGHTNDLHEETKKRGKKKRKRKI